MGRECEIQSIMEGEGQARKEEWNAQKKPNIM
jgi:hypothetical protein